MDLFGRNTPVDFDKLTNDAIRDELLARGYDTGPVTETTRNVYLKKLRRLIGEEEKETRVSQPAAQLGAKADGLGGSPERAQISRSPPKPRMPTNAAYVTAQELPESSLKHHALPPTQSEAITDTLPKADGSGSPEYRPPESLPVPVRRYSPPRKVERVPDAQPGTESEPLRFTPKPRITPVPVLPKIVHNPVKVRDSYPYTNIPRNTPNYRTPLASNLVSLLGEDKRKKEKERDDTEEDLYGEESSRILSSNKNADYTYSTRYSSGQGSAMRFNSGRSVNTFENSYSNRNSIGVYGRRGDGVTVSKPAPKIYGKIGLALLLATILAVFIFFVMQNYAALEQGEANKEEL